MVTIPPLSESCDDPDEDDLEFLLGQIQPLLRALRAALARVLRDPRADPESERELVRLIEARQRLQEWLGEALLAHVAGGGGVRLRARP